MAVLRLKSIQHVIVGLAFILSCNIFEPPQEFGSLVIELQRNDDEGATPGGGSRR